MNKENNKYWALILGASSGFGESIGIKLAEDGYNIAGVHLDRQATMHNVERITKEIEKHGVEAKFFNANAADEKKRGEIVNELKTMADDQPVIKVLVHSLAFGTLKGFTKLTDEQPITKAQMEMTLDVMAHSIVYWTQDLVANNLLVKKARIFGMTSSGGHSVIPAYGAVSAAKATLESHIRQLAYELGPLEVAVNSVMAGVTETPALKKIPGNEPMMQVAQRKNPRDRLTTPDDIAKVISILCMDGAEWISGGIINADGGEDIVNFVGQGKKGNL
jgi:NAD(P)-dependent dehydrogenase (short-subunit alcohol dehydrogenase family)